MATPPINVLLLLFDGFNTLDVNGPLEVLCNYALRDPDTMACPFKIHLASKDPRSTVKAFEFVKLAASLSFSDATDMIKAKKIDVLITPGYAPTSVGPDLIAKNDDIFNPIRAFLALDSTDKQRWMISICVGAMLNASVGVFDDRPATTHFLALADLEKASKNKAIVLHQRWVDGGSTDGNVRILSSGGISCGIDGMLYYISQALGLTRALAVAKMMDYAWNAGPLGNFPASTQQTIEYPLEDN